LRKKKALALSEYRTTIARLSSQKSSHQTDYRSFGRVKENVQKSHP